jgi:alkylation response protein AidB-like acyl-CoA dehydrogenase
MNEEEHKLELELLLLVKFSSTKQKFLLKTCYQMGNGFKIAMNALNVGRISLLLLVLTQRRVITNAVYANERVQFNTNSTIWSHSF